MKRTLFVATTAVALFAASPSALGAAHPPQQGCPAFNLTLFAGKGGGLGQGLRAIATPGTPGGVGQAVQAFCENQ